eukprot:m.92210 g.92210  ORF g.92210 m.92210 type:complete len:1114 (+) comp12980_c0_seq3:197-3538(+)
MWESSCEMQYPKQMYTATAKANVSVDAPKLVVPSYRFDGNTKYTFFNNSAPAGLYINSTTGVIFGKIDSATQPGKPLQVFVEVTTPTDPRICREISPVTFTVNPTLQVSAFRESEELTIGHPFERQLDQLLNIKGGTAPYTVTSSGNLPLGVELSSDQATPSTMISGIPTSKPLTNATTVEFCVSDSVGATACATLRFHVFDQLAIGGCITNLTAQYETTLNPPQVYGGTGFYTFNLTEHQFTTYSFNTTTGKLVVTVDKGGDYTPLIEIKDTAGAWQAVRMLLHASPPLNLSVPHVTTNIAGSGFTLMSRLKRREASTAVSTEHDDNKTLPLTILYTVVGELVNLRLSPVITGGRQPYDVRVSLPIGGGLSFDSDSKVVLGTPTKAINFTLGMTVKDSNGAIKAQQLAVIVVHPAPEVPTFAPSGDSRQLPLIIGMCVGLLILLVLLIVFQRQRQLSKELREQQQKQSQMSHKEKLMQAVLDRIPPRHRDKFVFLEQKRIALRDRLGKGFFGDVHQGMYVEETDVNHVTISRDRLVAVKRQCFTSDNQWLAVADEVAILQKFRECPNIVYLQGMVVMDNLEELAWTVTEYCGGGDLQHYLETLEAIHVESMYSHLRQIASAMDYIHSRGYVHRDIAARNIFLLSTEDVVKLGDFGLAASINSETDGSRTSLTSDGPQQREQLAFPRSTSAPELISPLATSHTTAETACASDCWSFGVLMYVYVTGGVSPDMHLQEYLEDSNPKALYTALTESNPFSLEALPTEIDETIRSCLQVDPSQRPSAHRLSSMSRGALHETEWLRPFPAHNLATGALLPRSPQDVYLDGTVDDGEDGTESRDVIGSLSPSPRQSPRQSRSSLSPRTRTCRTSFDVARDPRVEQYENGAFAMRVERQSKAKVFTSEVDFYRNHTQLAGRVSPTRSQGGRRSSSPVISATCSRTQSPRDITYINTMSPQPTTTTTYVNISPMETTPSTASPKRFHAQRVAESPTSKQMVRPTALPAGAAYNNPAMSQPQTVHPVTSHVQTQQMVNTMHVPLHQGVPATSRTPAPTPSYANAAAIAQSMESSVQLHIPINHPSSHKVPVDATKSSSQQQRQGTQGHTEMSTGVMIDSSFV